MDFTSLTLSDYILIIGCLFMMGSAIRILYVGIRNPTNVFFAIALSFLGLYVLSNFMIDYVRDSFASLLWVRISAIAVIFGSTSLFLFGRSYDNRVDKRRGLIDLVTTYGFALVVSGFAFTSFAIQGVNINVFPVAVIRGPYYYAIVVVTLFYIALAAVSLFNSYKIAYRIEKYQLKYILSGLAIIVLITSVTNILLPILGQQEFSRIGPSFLVVLAVMSSYALTNSELSDLNFVLLRGSFFIAIVMLYVTAFAIIFQFLNEKYGSIYSFNSVIILLGFGCTSMYLMNKIKGFEDKVLQTLDRSRRLDIYNKVNRIFIKYQSTKEILPLLEKYLSLGFLSKDVQVVLEKDPEFYDFKTREIISFDKLTLKILRGYHLSSWESNTHLVMKKMNAAIIVPLTLEHEILGNIIFQEKVVSSPYTLNEILFFESLADSVVVGLKKVLLFEEVQDFNFNLQKKIEQATKTLREQKGQLEEKYQFEKDMMGIMGHELRTPMTVARGMAELLMQKLTGGKKIENSYLSEKLNRIFGSITKESDLIQTMLSTSHIDNRKINFQASKFDLMELIDFAMFSFKKDAEAKNLKLNFKEPDFEAPQMNNDQNRLQEVVNNLISNAIKYTNEGEIDVWLEKHDDFIHFIVQDTGIGIPKEEISNIGRKFYRIHQHLDEKKDIVRAGGTGLGLYVVKGLLEAMGGELKVESVEGKGSKFTAIFPIVLKQNDKSFISDKPLDEHDMFQQLGFSREKDLATKS